MVVKLRATICSVVALLVTVGVASGQQPKTDLPPAPLPILPLEESWRTSLAAPPAADASFDALRIYLPIESGSVVAIRRDTGETAWQRDLRTRWPLVVADGGLLIATDNELALLDAATGSTKWNWTLPRRLLVAPAAAPALAIVILEQGDVTAIRLSDGAEQWRVTIPNDAPLYAPLTGEPGMIHIVLENGDVAAITTGDGRIAWRHRIGGRLGRPAWVEDRVLVGSLENVLYALDSRSGDVVWKWKTGGDVIGAGGDSRRVYFASLDNLLRAVNRGNGNQQWRAEITSRPAAPPLVVGNVVIVTSVATVTAYNVETGAEVASHTAAGQLQGVPLVDPTLRPFTPAAFVLTKDGRLTGLVPVASLFRELPARPLDSLPGVRLADE